MATHAEYASRRFPCSFVKKQVLDYKKVASLQLVMCPIRSHRAIGILPVARVSIFPKFIGRTISQGILIFLYVAYMFLDVEYISVIIVTIDKVFKIWAKCIKQVHALLYLICSITNYFLLSIIYIILQEIFKSYTVEIVIQS